MSEPKNFVQKDTGMGWFCLVLGVFVLGMNARFFVPVVQAMLGPRTGSAGTTIGMGMGLGMPFFIIGACLIFSGWFVILSKQTKIYGFLFVAGTFVAVALLSTLVWQTETHPRRSPLTQAIEEYKTYTLDELNRQLEKEIRFYENTNSVGFIIGRSRIKIQALMQILTDKYPEQAKDILKEISANSKDEKIRNLASNSLFWIKPTYEGASSKG